MSARPHILVIGPSWIGDMVMAQSLFMRLRDRLPKARIDVLCPPATASLLTRMPQVDDAVALTIEHGELALVRRWRTAVALRETGYDQAIVLQRSAKAAIVPWLARIPQRTGYRGEMRYGLINDVRRLDKQRYPLKAEHYALLGLARDGDVLDSLSQPRLQVDETNRQRLIDQHALDTARPAVGFAPGAAFGGAKQWPTSHYARLAEQLDARGISVWLFGGPADRDIADRVMAAAPSHGVDFCERTTLTDVIDLASLTHTVVGNDTGIMHLASASTRRVIGLYGSTHPDYAPPLAEESLAFWLALDCAPCRARVCPLGHRACLRDLPVADVLRACLEPEARDIDSLHRAG